jgi:hypothetical protein
VAGNCDFAGERPFPRRLATPRCAWFPPRSGTGTARPSSSRSQLAVCRACIVAWLASGSVSGVIRRCPLLLPVIVTQLVTHWPSTL